MFEYVRLEDLSAEEIKDLLALDVNQLTDDQALAIRDFVWRVGGLQNARRAVDMLLKIERAA